MHSLKSPYIFKPMKYQTKVILHQDPVEAPSQEMAMDIIRTAIQSMSMSTNISVRNIQWGVLVPLPDDWDEDFK